MLNNELYSIVEKTNDDLFHYGVKRRSGRFPWGSGKNPYQRYENFYSRIKELKAQGITKETEIAKRLNCTTKELRDTITAAKEEELVFNTRRAAKLRDKGYGPTEIARLMGAANESTVRGWLKKYDEGIESAAFNTAMMLMSELETKRYLDVGKYAEMELGISRQKWDAALEILRDEGYNIQTIKVPQATMPGKTTSILTLAPPGDPKEMLNEIYHNTDKIESVTRYSPDGKTWQETQYPASIDSSRIAVKYSEEGGTDKDGVIEIRRGLKDINLGNSIYSQVRIAVDGTYYIKGMAIYRDDMPEGKDILINSNKHIGTPLKGSGDESVLKKLKADPNMPFGAAIMPKGQSYYNDPDGEFVKVGADTYKKAEPGEEGERYSLNAVNKVNDQSDWTKWSKTLSSQFLSKQDPALIERQLNLSLAEKLDEFDEICSYTQPEVKKKLLASFADSCDRAAVDLKAAGLPGQQSHVILPIESLKDNEVFAPNYQDGSKVALVRYPHQATFEIPILTVNNKNAEGKSIIGPNAQDAIGINHTVADKMSGADFDGDTVLVLPTNSRVKILSEDTPKELKNWDYREIYKKYPGMKVMTEETKQLEMGKVSNLISDMQLMGAPQDEVIRAVKHSMVVIDAAKHELDWKSSERDNGIIELKKKWQGVNEKTGQPKGASTIISRASSEDRIAEREGYVRTNPETGEKIFKDTDRTYPLYKKEKITVINPRTGKETTKKVYLKDEDGNLIPQLDKDGNPKYAKATTKTTKMANTKDAYTLTQFGDPLLNNKKENYYAEYANRCKALANKARKTLIETKSSKKDKAAAEKYAEEVLSLTTQLDRALSNYPKERQAQAKTAYEVREYKKNNPYEDTEYIKKFSQQCLANNRARYGANKKDVSVTISPKEWEAIRNNAVSPSVLRKILENTDEKLIKEYATPRTKNEITQTQKDLIKTLANSGYTNKQIAERLGVSTSTIGKYVNE